MASIEAATKNGKRAPGCSLLFILLAGFADYELDNFLLHKKPLDIQKTE
jgi:hypothetical protein